MHRFLKAVVIGLLVTSRAIADQPPAALDDVIVWSATRRLDWSDFKAKPPTNTLAGALSAISHNYSIGCRDQALQVRLQAVFVPAQSWVSYRITSSGLASRVGLQHEQTHFDLAEVYARRARKLFRELREPCPRSDDELNGMAERVFKEHWTAQRRYDYETENGQLGTRQGEWEKRVAAELSALASFADGPRSPFQDRDNLRATDRRSRRLAPGKAFLEHVQPLGSYSR